MSLHHATGGNIDPGLTVVLDAEGQIADYTDWPSIKLVLGQLGLAGERLESAGVLFMRGIARARIAEREWLRFELAKTDAPEVFEILLRFDAAAARVEAQRLSR